MDGGERAQREGCQKHIPHFPYVGWPKAGRGSHEFPHFH